MTNAFIRAGTLATLSALALGIGSPVGAQSKPTLGGQPGKQPEVNLGQSGGQSGQSAGQPKSEPAANGAMTGKFRISINGFQVDNATRDDLLDTDGIGDEVFIVANVVAVDAEANQAMPAATIRSRVYGEARKDIAGNYVWKGRQLAGTGGRAGGLRSTNRVPTQTPWLRTFTLGAPEYLPMELWCGTLTEGKNAIVVVPSVWEWDGYKSHFGTMVNWGNQVAADLSGNSKEIGAIIGAAAGATTGGVVTAAILGSKILLGAAVALEETGLVGGESDRPIVMKRSAANKKVFEFTPEHKFVLNYRSADFSSKAAGSLGSLPPGVFPIQYSDDPFHEGVYTLYVHVERMDGKRCAHEPAPAPPQK